MKDQIPKDNWRLQEESTPDDKWLLQESEQRVTDRWELNDAPLEPDAGWQPVEYVKPPRKIGAWLLPTIITAALLVVIGYTAVRVLPGMLNPQPTPQDDPAVAAVATDTPTPEDAAPTAPVEPTSAPAQESPAPAAPTPEPPTPAAPAAPVAETVMQRFAIVNAPTGLNARELPTTDATIIRILEDGETLWVFGEQGEWLEVFVAETPLVADQPFAGTVGWAASEFFTIVEREVSPRLVDQILAYTGKAPVEPVAAPPAEEPADAADPPAAATRITVTVNAIAGVNARREPILDESTIIRLIENGVVLPALARSADTQWIQVQLPDGLLGWIAAEFLTPSGDLATLPIPGQEPAPDATTPVTETPPSGEVTTTGFDVPAPYTNVIPADDVPAIYVTVPDGVNVRQAPTIDAEVEAVAPQGAVLPARGRSADGQWVQVELPTGVLGWVFRDTVNVTGAVGALPAVGGPPAEPTPTPAPVILPTPTPTPAEPTPEPVATPVTATVIPFFLPVSAEPSNDSETLARYARGASFTVIGRTAASDWLQVTAADGVIGWVVAGNVNVSGDLDGVPVVP